MHLYILTTCCFDMRNWQHFFGINVIRVHPLYLNVNWHKTFIINVKVKYFEMEKNPKKTLYFCFFRPSGDRLAASSFGVWVAGHREVTQRGSEGEKMVRKEGSCVQQNYREMEGDIGNHTQMHTNQSRLLMYFRSIAAVELWKGLKGLCAEKVMHFHSVMCI